MNLVSLIHTTFVSELKIVSFPPPQSSISRLNNIRRPLCQRIQRTSQVTAHLERHHRRIDDSDVGTAVDEVIISNHTTHLPRHHSRGGNVVEVTPVRVLHPLEPNLFGGILGHNIKTRVRLAREIVAERRRVCVPPRRFRSSDLLANVVVELEVIRIDPRGSGGIGGGDVDIAARERHQTPITNRGGSFRRGFDQDFGDDDFLVEDQGVLEFEELLDGGAVCGASGDFDDFVCPGGDGGLDVLLDLFGLLAEDVLGVEVGDEV